MTEPARTKTLDDGSPVVFLAVPAAHSERSDEAPSPLLVVRRDCTVLSLNAETLDTQWTVGPKFFLPETTVGGDAATQNVDFVCLSYETDITSGIAKGREGQLAALLPAGCPQASSQLLAMITATPSPEKRGVLLRHLHIAYITSSSLFPVHVCPLPPRKGKLHGERPDYRLDASAACLQELWQDQLNTYSLSESIPKARQRFHLPKATSFLQIHAPSILVSLPGRIELYDSKYQSLQAGRAFKEPADEGSSRIRLTHYLPHLELAVGIKGSKLASIQINAQSGRGTKRRATSALIDSIGRGLPRSRSDAGVEPHQSAVAFSEVLPGSVSAKYFAELESSMKTAAELATKDLAAFDALMASKFGIELEQAEPALANGVNGINGSAVHDSEKQGQAWKWPESPFEYPSVDRRWIIFAIQQAFSIQETPSPRLRLRLPPTSNLVVYLVDSGRLDYSTVVSALVFHPRSGNGSNRSDAGSVQQADVAAALANADPSLELLAGYVSCTRGLGPRELCATAKEFMRSLELLADNSRPLKSLFPASETNGTDATAAAEGDLEEEVRRLEQDLSISIAWTQDAAEGGEDGEDVRVRGLSLTLARLGQLATGASGPSPAASQEVVIAIRETFTEAREVMALMWVLRGELVKGGWTGRYVDGSPLGTNDEDGGHVHTINGEGGAESIRQDASGAIAFLADLLARCVDAVAPAGWLVNDALFSTVSSASSAGPPETAAAAAGGSKAKRSPAAAVVAGSLMPAPSDFLTALKHEVSAALEGVEEAVYLRGLVYEALRFARAAAGASETGKFAASVVAAGGTADKPIPLVASHDGVSGGMLPFGLKPRRVAIASHKVVSGGEVVTRSAREIGHLVSKKVAPYGLEMIAI